jgi:hypothetical protein
MEGRWRRGKRVGEGVAGMGIDYYVLGVAKFELVFIKMPNIILFLTICIAVLSFNFKGNSN